MGRSILLQLVFSHEHREVKDQLRKTPGKPVSADQDDSAEHMPEM